jgi:hypothetical protein
MLTTGEALILREVSNATNLIKQVRAQGAATATLTLALADRCRELEAEITAMKNQIMIPRRKLPELVIGGLCLVLAGISLSALILTPLTSLALFGLAAASSGLVPAVLSLRLPPGDG